MSYPSVCLLGGALHAYYSGVFARFVFSSSEKLTPTIDVRLVRSESLDTLKTYAARVNYSNFAATGKRCDKPKTARLHYSGSIAN